MVVNALNQLSTSCFIPKYRPLKLPLSCEVVQKGGFWVPICRGRGYSRLWTCFFKPHLLPSMWPILVEFRSASSKIRRGKKKKKDPVKICPPTYYVGRAA